MSQDLDELSRQTDAKKEEWLRNQKKRMDTNEKSIIGAGEYDFYRRREEDAYNEYKAAQADESKQLVFEELRSKYRSQNFGSRFLAALAGKKPKWGKIKGYSKEEIDTLIKIANGSDFHIKNAIKSIKDRYEKKIKDNPKDASKLRKEMEKRIRDYRFNELNAFLAKSRQELEKHHDVEEKRGWTR